MKYKERSQYKVRTAAVADVEAIRRMHAQSWLDTYPNERAGVSYEWVRQQTDKWLTSEALEQSREYLGSRFSDSEHFYRVATHNGKVVGFVHGLVQEGHKHLGALYIAKDHQGTGLAQILMDYVVEWFGVDMANLEVVSYNERAKAFYRKYGFEETDKVCELFNDKLPVTEMVRKGDSL